MSIYEGFDPSQVPEPFGNRHEPKHPPADMAGLDGLIERLRSVDVSWSETGEWCAEAADRIEALEAENMMLREERDRLINFVNIMCEEYGLEYDGVVKQ